MLTTYLNTADNLFLDSAGNFWRDGYPRFTVRGKEQILINLVTDSPGYGTEAAVPNNWPVDSFWGDVPGIAAVLTIDNDYKHRIKGSVSAGVSAGAMSVSISLPGLNNAAEIPLTGIITLYSVAGDFENIGYSSREISGKTAVFTLDTPLENDYVSGADADVKQTPLCVAYLNSSESDWRNGKLVFDLTVDSARLRSMTEYSDAASISIEGVELLLYTSGDTGAVTLLRSYLWDTPALINSIGDPGYAAPVPDKTIDYIAAEITRQIEDRILNGSW